MPRHFSAEEEADREGYNLLIRAGYDPTDAPKLFDVLNKDLEEPKIEEPFFFGTQPRLQERHESYSRLLKERAPESTGETGADRFMESQPQRTQVFFANFALLCVTIFAACAIFFTSHRARKRGFTRAKAPSECVQKISPFGRNDKRVIPNEVRDLDFFLGDLCRLRERFRVLLAAPPR